MDNKEIEFWENEYLKQIFYMLNLDKEKMLNGLNTKEEIRNDWEKYLGDETSDFAIGSERIFYWLFNQFGKPNSSPIGSDMFFETYNAYVHIDVKTITLKNIGDFNRNIFVGDNQNSYIGNIHMNNGETRQYHGNLPTFYTKTNNEKKICLTYFLVILYNTKKDLDIQTIVLLSMPNGQLNTVYKDDILSAGKNRGKIRFNYTKASRFELLENKPYRIKVLYLKDNINQNIKDRLKFIEKVFKNG